MKRIVLVLLLVGAQYVSAQDPVRLDTRTADRIWFENVSFEKDPNSTSQLYGIYEMESVTNLCATGMDLLQVVGIGGNAYCTLKDSHVRQLDRDSAANLISVSTMFDFQGGRPTKSLSRVSGAPAPQWHADIMVEAFQCNGDTTSFVTEENLRYCLRGPSFKEDAFTTDLVGDDQPDLVVRSINDSVWYNIVPNGSLTPFECDKTIHVPAVPGRTIVTETVTKDGLVVIARDTAGSPNDKLYAMELSILEVNPDSLEFSWRDFSSLSLRCDGCEQPKEWFVGKDGKKGDVYIYRKFKTSTGADNTVVDRLANRDLERVTRITDDQLWIYGTVPDSHVFGVPLVVFQAGTGEEMYFARLDNISKPFGYLTVSSHVRLKQFRVIRDGNGDNKPDILQGQVDFVQAPFNLLNIYEKFELAGPTSVYEQAAFGTAHLEMRGTTVLLDGNVSPSVIEIYDGLGSIESQTPISSGVFEHDIAPSLIGKAPGLRLVVRRLKDRVQTVSFVYTR
ncbi:MAG: hypothetical protein IPF59_04310 [Ignavibacteria bacterium]|nr:hypothetical protein [Ignavibacteria bacterium]MBK6419547.1 hypothetical protein [Ignavibacteria bacterium]